MKSTVCLLTLAAAMLVSPVFAQEQPAAQTAVQQAVTQVPLIRDQMNDPDSFQLARVFLTHPDKHTPYTSVCFEFRAHNAMGGYGRGGRAMLSGKDNKLHVFEADPRYTWYQGYDMAGFHQGPCGESKFEKDITAEVKAALAAVAK